MGAEGQAHAASFCGLEQGREVLGNVRNATVKRFFVRSGPGSPCEIFSELSNLFGSQKSMNLHATKPVFKSVVAALHFLATVGELLKRVDEFVVEALTVMVGDASVRANEFKQVGQR